MHATLIHIHVKPEYINAFIDATQTNHEASIVEPGNLRFDVMQAVDDPARFVLYEAYASTEHAAAHKQTAHYLEWRDRVAEWMVSPRQGVAYYGLFP